MAKGECSVTLTQNPAHTARRGTIAGSSKLEIGSSLSRINRLGVCQSPSGRRKALLAGNPAEMLRVSCGEASGNHQVIRLALFPADIRNAPEGWWRGRENRTRANEAREQQAYIGYIRAGPYPS